MCWVQIAVGSVLLLFVRWWLMRQRSCLLQLTMTFEVRGPHSNIMNTKQITKLNSPVANFIQYSFSPFTSRLHRLFTRCCTRRSVVRRKVSSLTVSTGMNVFKPFLHIHVLLNAWDISCYGSIPFVQMFSVESSWSLEFFKQSGRYVSQGWCPQAVNYCF